MSNQDLYNEAMIAKEKKERRMVRTVKNLGAAFLLAMFFFVAVLWIYDHFKTEVYPFEQAFPLSAEEVTHSSAYLLYYQGEQAERSTAYSWDLTPEQTGYLLEQLAAAEYTEVMSMGMTGIQITLPAEVRLTFHSQSGQMVEIILAEAQAIINPLYENAQGAVLYGLSTEAAHQQAMFAYLEQCREEAGVQPSDALPTGAPTA